MSNIPSVTIAETKSIIDTANALADAARRVILPRFRSDLLITENKSFQSFDPVTDADKIAEKAMINELKRLRPTDSVFGAAIISSAPAAGLRLRTPPATPARTEFLLNPHVAPLV